MPWLKDTISSFKVSPETTKYKSPKFEILDWMQRHPEELQETTFNIMAHSMKSEFVDTDEKLLLSRIGQLVDEHLIFYFPYRRTGKKHYYLNYFHKDFPPEIKARASEEELSKIRNMVHIYEHKVSDQLTISPQIPIVQKVSQEVKQEEAKQEEKPNQEKPIVIPIDTKNLPEGGLSVNLNIQFVFNN